MSVRTHQTGERLQKGLLGKEGRYLRVRKRDSEKGLSSERRGRLKEGAMPSH